MRVVTIDGFDQPDDRHLAKVAQFLATVVIPVGMVQRERLESHHEFTANASIRQPLEEFVDILHPVHTLLRASPGSGATANRGPMSRPPWRPKRNRTRVVSRPWG